MLTDPVRQQRYPSTRSGSEAPRSGCLILGEPKWLAGRYLVLRERQGAEYRLALVSTSEV